MRRLGEIVQQMLRKEASSVIDVALEMRRLSGQLTDKELIHVVYSMLGDRNMSETDLTVMLMRIDYLIRRRYDRSVD